MERERENMNGAGKRKLLHNLRIAVLEQLKIPECEKKYIFLIEEEDEIPFFSVYKNINLIKHYNGKE
ncbi:hypothetical protein E2320_004170 [Naja naja]|nr:hypothetical protein E2320_004170 [Naja naja]